MTLPIVCAAYTVRNYILTDDPRFSKRVSQLLSQAPPPYYSDFDGDSISEVLQYLQGYINYSINWHFSAVDYSLNCTLGFM